MAIKRLIDKLFAALGFESHPADASRRPVRQKRVELSMEDRVALADRFYGLYMFPQYLFDARREKNAQARESHLSDLQCGMDNMRVPIWEDQLTSQERMFLDSRPERRKGDIHHASR